MGNIYLSVHGMLAMPLRLEPSIFASCWKQLATAMVGVVTVLSGVCLAQTDVESVSPS